MTSDLIGWISSALLIVTLSIQLRKQWKAKSSQAVSIWLFAGQLLAEIGFVSYSISVGNWIFTFTNSVLIIENLAGLWITQHFKKSAGK